MSIDDEGFLSEDISVHRDKIRQKFPRHFDLLHRVNSFIQKSKFSIKVNNASGQQMTAASMMVKLVNDVQASVLLLERGLAPQARILLRSALEALFLLGNICEREEFYNAFIMDGEERRLALMRAIHRSSAPAFDGVRELISDDLIAQTKQSITDEGLTFENVEQLARQIKLDMLYDGPYRLFCQDTHSSARALEQYLETDENDTPTSFAWGPVDDHLEAELAGAVLTLILCIGYINKLFCLNLNSEINGFESEALKLDPPVEASMKPRLKGTQET